MRPASSRPAPSKARSSRQRGITLIEIMVGLTIGLLIIAVALGAVLVSRQLSSSTSEAARLQQQASYALRIIGQQVRQAGALRLDLAYGRTPPATGFLTMEPAEPVAFDATFVRATDTLGSSTTRPLQTGYAFYSEQLTSNSSTPVGQMRDCLGSVPSGALVRSAFFLHRPAGAPSGELRCAGSKSGEGAQALIADVADFQVSWLRERSVLGEPVVDRVDASTAAASWPSVQAVEVCLEMVGTDVIDTGTSTYRPCGWTTGSAETPRGNRLRLVYRSTFQLRTQGALE